MKDGKTQEERARGREREKNTRIMYTKKAHKESNEKETH